MGPKVGGCQYSLYLKYSRFVIMLNVRYYYFVPHGIHELRVHMHATWVSHAEHMGITCTPHDITSGVTGRGGAETSDRENVW